MTDYDQIMNINSRTAFILSQLVSPHLVASKGNMVHVSSVTGTRAFPGVLGYCVSKAALDQIVRYYGGDLKYFLLSSDWKVLILFNFGSKIMI